MTCSNVLSSEALVLFAFVCLLSAFTPARSSDLSAEQYRYLFENEVQDDVQSRWKRRIDADSKTTADPFWPEPDDNDALIDKWVGNDTGNDTSEKVDHTYYEVEYTPNSQATFDKAWVDVDALLESGEARGNSSVPQLANAYRRAVKLSLRFDFPFYGHLLRNVTVASGGFCYVGEQSGGIISATQYIAPFMANFQTTEPGSGIAYADTVGNYTFQVKLMKNGDVEFVYKNIPNTADVPDSRHPKKFGLSDAYFVDREDSSGVTRRVIYEYHRIEIPAERVTSNAVIKFNAIPGVNSTHFSARPSEQYLSERDVDDAQTRHKRQLGADAQQPSTTTDPTWIPDNSDTQIHKWTGNDTGNVTHEKVDHTYYHVEYTPNSQATFDKAWVDVDALLKSGKAKGNSSHPLLQNSYRRAVSFSLRFDFPFYGHLSRNVTIATGGFCYIGNQEHRFLAATQFIAPFMANFETSEPGSNIVYADTGDMFVVEWREVYLQLEKHFGNYTFQAKMMKNGDIEFVYKNIPHMENISDAHHPKKFGLSDAYLFEYKLPTAMYSSKSVTKRVIYEYHRINIPEERVVSNAVIKLSAQPVCILYQTCEQCASVRLRKFNCSWCEPQRGRGFCSDEVGLNRRRQDWLTGKCHEKSRTLYCPIVKAGQDVSETGDGADVTMETGPGDVTEQMHVGAQLDRAGKQSKAGVSTGGVLVFMLFIVVLASGAWLAYAYYNPHTTSGQLLIKYRPSQWTLAANNDVHYTASVHM